MELLFWILMLLWFVLIAILGWHAFGSPVHIG